MFVFESLHFLYRISMDDIFLGHPTSRPGLCATGQGDGWPHQKSVDPVDSEGQSWANT